MVMRFFCIAYFTEVWRTCCCSDSQRSPLEEGEEEVVFIPQNLSVCEGIPNVFVYYFCDNVLGHGPVVLKTVDSHEMSSVIVSSHGWRFQLLNQNPDHIDEDDYVDLVWPNDKTNKEKQWEK